MEAGYRSFQWVLRWPVMLSENASNSEPMKAVYCWTESLWVFIKFENKITKNLRL